MGEILADTAARRECLEHRSPGAGGARRVRELTMDLVHQLECAVQHRAARLEAICRVVAEGLLDPDMMGLHPEAARIEVRAAQWLSRIGQRVADFLPAGPIRLVHIAGRADLDPDFSE